MASASINIHEAKTHFSRLVDRAAAGEEIVIAKAGKPVAKLVPLGRDMTPRKLGQAEGEFWMADDFDGPLPDELLRLFYGEDDPNPEDV
jgi:prevent-host-death family protein